MEKICKVLEEFAYEFDLRINMKKGKTEFLVFQTNENGINQEEASN